MRVGLGAFVVLCSLVGLLVVTSRAAPVDTGLDDGDKSLAARVDGLRSRSRISPTRKLLLSFAILRGRGKATGKNSKVTAVGKVKKGSGYLIASQRVRSRSGKSNKNKKKKNRRRRRKNKNL
ncbi:hypothetical protein BSKO_12358 [Bryopsis sp. KO-2023]|nr:hypothetical protein BSKO_12358 [Bryopsis sp. KO-2023]